MKISKILLFAMPLILWQYHVNGQCSELVWADEFDYEGLPDSTKWSYDVGGGGWGNNELEYYTYKRRENARVENGRLIIEARKETFLNNGYTSARLISRLKGDWLYGRIEVKAKLPPGRGTWPAIWMMPTDGAYGGWPNSGEIDIMEHVGYEPGIVHSTIHTDYYNGAEGTQKGSGITVTDAFTAFHLYSVEWTPQQMDFYMDDIKYFSYYYSSDYKAWPFDKRFFLIMNLAVGGNWGGAQGVDTAVFPASMEIDYVRIYQAPENLVIHGPDKASPLQEDLHFFLFHDQEASYSWSLKGDGDFLSPTDSNEVIIRWGCTADTVLCHVVSSCDTYDLALPVGLMDYAIDGSYFVEPSQDNVLLIAPSLQGSTYTWTVPAGVSIMSGQGNDSLHAAWGEFPGSVSLAIENTCGTYETSLKLRFYGQYAYPDPDAPHLIPGILNATDYDYGGEGIAYHDAEVTNQGSGPREEEGVDTEFGDQGRANVGWISDEEWLEYTIRVTKDDYYQAGIRVASNASPRGPLRILINGEKRIPDIALPSTGSWSSFTTFIAYDIPFYTSDTLLRLYAVSGGFNLGNIIIDTFIPDVLKKTESGRILVYPNPFNDRTFIKSDIPIIKVVLTDLAGKILQVIDPEMQSESLILVCSDYRAGLYMLYVTTMDDEERVVKIIHM
jgi:beta-glucanase (GH16 family)